MCTFVHKQGGERERERERERGKKGESHVPRSLFCKFKTPVSFPEAAAFA